MYLLKPHTKKLETWAWWEGAFTNEELDYLQDKAKHASNTARVGGGVDTDIRRSQVHWITELDHAWVFERLGNIAAQINAEHFRFDLTGLCEPLQLTNYDQSENGMYGWHTDFGGAGVSRKLSMAMQLTDPADYVGGEFQIQTSPNAQTIRKQRGLIIIFPAYVLHQVSPVVQGSRQSLVAWVSGPPFK